MVSGGQSPGRSAPRGKACGGVTGRRRVMQATNQMLWRGGAFGSVSECMHQSHSKALSSDALVGVVPLSKRGCVLLLHGQTRKGIFLPA